MSDYDRGRKILKPFAVRLAQLERDLERALCDLSDKSLADVEAARQYLTDRNCWWAEYDLAKAKRPLLDRPLALAKARLEERTTA